jgi:hypothetical protein
LTATPQGLVAPDELFDKNPRLETVVGFLFAATAASQKHI